MRGVVAVLLLATACWGQRFEGKWTVVASNTGAKGKTWIIRNSGGSYTLDEGVAAGYGAPVEWVQRGNELIGTVRPPLSAWLRQWDKTPPQYVQQVYSSLVVRRTLRLLDEDRMEATENRFTIRWDGTLQNPIRLNGVEEEPTAFREVLVRAIRSHLLEVEKALRNGKVDQAAQALQRAEAEDPADARLAAYRSQIESKRAQLAEQAARDYVRKKPKDAFGHVTLGNVLRINGKTDEAIAAYEAALRLDPNDRSARENLARLAPHKVPPAATAGPTNATPGTSPAGGRPEAVACSKCEADLQLEDKRCKDANPSDLIKYHSCLNAAIAQRLKCGESCRP